MSTDIIYCNGFVFFGNFDSGNLQDVELVAEKKETSNQSDPDYIFNVRTRPDCYGTQYENSNKTWFFFGVRSGAANCLVRINLLNMNKQAKMYSQGMAPVYRSIPGRISYWRRIKDKPVYTSNNGMPSLTFHFDTTEDLRTVHFFAFTYPYTYTELQSHLKILDHKFLTQPCQVARPDDIYYKRECITHSLEGRRIDLLTISSYSNITNECEARLKNLFKDNTVQRPFKFHNKKVIFISARVHPGETPSSFVFNGFLRFILTPEDQQAIILRRKYVFKLIPFLNPDGVVRGHYRTDTRGVNLNRLYLRPSHILHPSVFAARSLVRYHHYWYNEKEESYVPEDGAIVTKSNDESKTLCSKCIIKDKNGNLKPNDNIINNQTDKKNIAFIIPVDDNSNVCQNCCGQIENNLTSFDINDPSSISLDSMDLNKNNIQNSGIDFADHNDGQNSGLFLYMDLHGHASKKGIFIYGNHFDDLEKNVECMLLPKLLSMNNFNFHFTSCNFTERNMYLRDRRDGMSREGSGRVAVWKLTGLIHSYTLECNYNTGKYTNVLPPLAQNPSRSWTLNYPPKYTPSVYEETGRALGPSILDMTGDNPNSRLPYSEFHNLSSLKDWLRWHICSIYPALALNLNRLERPSKPDGQTLRSQKLRKLKIKSTRATRLRRGSNSGNVSSPSSSPSTNKKMLKLIKSNSKELFAKKLTSNKESSKKIYTSKESLVKKLPKVLNKTHNSLPSNSLNNIVPMLKTTKISKLTNITQNSACSNKSNNITILNKQKMNTLQIKKPEDATTTNIQNESEPCCSRSLKPLAPTPSNLTSRLGASFASTSVLRINNTKNVVCDRLQAGGGQQENIHLIESSVNDINKVKTFLNDTKATKSQIKIKDKKSRNVVEDQENQQQPKIIAKQLKRKTLPRPTGFMASSLNRSTNKLNRSTTSLGKLSTTKSRAKVKKASSRSSIFPSINQDFMKNDNTRKQSEIRPLSAPVRNKPTDLDKQSNKFYENYLKSTKNFKTNAVVSFSSNIIKSEQKVSKLKPSVVQNEHLLKSSNVKQTKIVDCQNLANCFKKSDNLYSKISKDSFDNINTNVVIIVDRNEHLKLSNCDSSNVAEKVNNFLVNDSNNIANESQVSKNINISNNSSNICESNNRNFLIDSSHIGNESDNNNVINIVNDFLNIQNFISESHNNKTENLNDSSIINESNICSNNIVIESKINKNENFINNLNVSNINESNNIVNISNNIVNESKINKNENCNNNLNGSSILNESDIFSNNIVIDLKINKNESFINNSIDSIIINESNNIVNESKINKNENCNNNLNGSNIFNESNNIINIFSNNIVNESHINKNENSIDNLNDLNINVSNIFLSNSNNIGNATNDTNVNNFLNNPNFINESLKIDKTISFIDNSLTKTSINENNPLNINGSQKINKNTKNIDNLNCKNINTHFENDLDFLKIDSNFENFNKECKEIRFDDNKLNNPEGVNVSSIDVNETIEKSNDSIENNNFLIDSNNSSNDSANDRDNSINISRDRNFLSKSKIFDKNISKLEKNNYLLENHSKTEPKASFLVVKTDNSMNEAKLNVEKDFLFSVWAQFQNQIQQVLQNQNSNEKVTTRGNKKSQKTVQFAKNMTEYNNNNNNSKPIKKISKIPKKIVGILKSRNYPSVDGNKLKKLQNKTKRLNKNQKLTKKQLVIRKSKIGSPKTTQLVDKNKQIVIGKQLVAGNKKRIRDKKGLVVKNKKLIVEKKQLFVEKKQLNFKTKQLSVRKSQINKKQLIVRKRKIRKNTNNLKKAVKQVKTREKQQSGFKNSTKRKLKTVAGSNDVPPPKRKKVGGSLIKLKKIRN